MAPTFLMCPPDYYEIAYEINPWMDVRRKADPARARRQWEALYDCILRLGGGVELVAPVKGLPDMVFTANAGLVCGDRVILSSFRHAQRQGESPYFEAWFEKQGFKVHRPPPDCFFEGAGDGLFVGEDLFAGYRVRSDIRAHLRIGELLGRRVLSLELVEKYFYHLDTCFCPLDDRRALYYPGAFDAYGRKVIEDAVPRPLAVGGEDARRFGCNAVVLDRRVILHEGCGALRSALEAEGCEVHELDLSEFHKAGGSAKCLTLRVR